MPLKEFKVRLPSNWDKDMFDEINANVSWNSDGTANVSCSSIDLGKVKQLIRDYNLEVLNFTTSMHFDNGTPSQRLEKNDLD